MDDNLVFKGLFETYRGVDAYMHALGMLLQITVRLDVRKIVADGNDAAIFFELQTKALVDATV